MKEKKTEKIFQIKSLLISFDFHMQSRNIN